MGQGTYVETPVGLLPILRSFPFTPGDWRNHFPDAALPGIGSFELSFFGASLNLFCGVSRHV